MAAPRKRTVAKTAAAKEVKAQAAAAEKEVKEAEAKAEAVKPEEKEALVKKPAAAKKETVKKTASKKEAKVSVFVQYLGKEISAESLAAEARKAFVAAGHKEDEIETIDVYVKPEENAAYYAVNGIGSEEYRIQL